MNTLMIIYAVLSIGIIFVLVGTELIPTYKVSLLCKEIILAILLLALAVGILFAPTYFQKSNTVGDAELKAQFSDADLYYDAKDNVYFAVETNRWNPLELYKRVEIPQELALQKLLQFNESNANED